MTFNGHYAVPPTGFYSQPSSVPPFNPQSFQYGIPPPIPSGNLQRFDANAQIPTPPPIPFWNPEILKQLSQLPIPPPPPPPIPLSIGTPPFIRLLANTPQIQSQPVSNYGTGDIRERAKQAITALNPHIRYQDFLDEGISQSVLDKLYAELGIDKGQSGASSFSRDGTEKAVQPASETISQNSQENVAESVLDAGLERKDRIARLLAAKKGRVNTVTNSPAQASTPEVVLSLPEADSVATPDKAPTSAPDESVRVKEKEKTRPPVEKNSTPSAPAVRSPTSSRREATVTSTLSSIFSIPGLSMISDDPNDSGNIQTRPKVNTNMLNARMAALKADMLRKKALQDGMPVLNAEVEKTREQLTEKRNQLATIREDILTKEHQLSEVREEESHLLKEIENLESQLMKGENGQKQFNRELTQLNDHITEQQAEAVEQASEPSNLQSSTPKYLSDIGPADRDDGKVVNELSLQASSRSLSENTVETNSQASIEDVPMGDVESSSADNVENEASYETQSTHLTTTATPSVDPSMHGNDGETDDERMSIDGDSDAENSGSASMSDSGSDYEPALDQFEEKPQSITGEDDDGNDQYDPQNSNTGFEHSEIDIDNDEYEPSEGLSSIHVDAAQQTISDTEQSMRVDPHHAVERPTVQQAIEATPVEEVPPTSTFPTRHSSVDRVMIAAKPNEKSLTRQVDFPARQSAYEETPPLDNRPSSDRSFAPYQSPLSMLKSYRFHPQFTDLVPNGYRSLTYSNQVDVNRPVCASELEGKMCTDTECEDQHFAGMGLTDDKILVQMSSAFDIKDKAQRDGYLIGLKKVIADLRERGVKEFSEVAGALSKYRREWQATQDGLVV